MINKYFIILFSFYRWGIVSLMLMPRMEDNFGNKEYTTHNADVKDGS